MRRRLAYSINLYKYGRRGVGVVIGGIGTTLLAGECGPAFFRALPRCAKLMTYVRGGNNDVPCAAKQRTIGRIMLRVCDRLSKSDTGQGANDG